MRMRTINRVKVVQNILVPLTLIGSIAVMEILELIDLEHDNQFEIGCGSMNENI